MRVTWGISENPHDQAISPEQLNHDISEMGPRPQNLLRSPGECNTEPRLILINYSRKVKEETF